MFFPYRDDNPHTITPYVNYSLIAACVAVFIWQLSLGRDGELAVYMFGLIPGELFGSVRIDERIPRPPGILTAFTSMFLHGGFMHLIGNMMYLWIFGDNIEASLGHRRYFLIAELPFKGGHGPLKGLTKNFNFAVDTVEQNRRQPLRFLPNPGRAI